MAESRKASILLALIGLLALAPALLGDERTRLLALNTLDLAWRVVAISLAVGTPFAFLLVRTDLPGRKVMGFLLAMLLLVPLYLQAAAWQAGFGIQGWTSQIGWLPVLVKEWRGAIWVHAVAAIPAVVLIVGLGFWLVEPELEESALLDAPAWRVFRRITLGRAWPAVGAAALWVFVTTAGEMTVTNIFLVRIYAEELYTRITLGGDPDAGPWATWPSVAATAALVLVALAAFSRMSTYPREASQRGPWIFELGRWRWPLALIAFSLVLLLVGVPVGNLIYKAGIVVSRAGDGWLRAWSLEKCLTIVAAAPWKFRHEFGWSLLVGSLAATLAIRVAIPLAWSARRGGVAAAPAWSLAAVCLALPGPMIALALIALLNQPGVPPLNWLYDHSIAAPLLAQFVRALPLPFFILWHALRTYPQELVDSAALDGAGTFTQITRLVIPSRWPAVAAAWTVALAVAIGDLSASILVVPPGVDTLSIRIFGLIHFGVDDQVAGLCLVLLAGFCVFTTIGMLLVRKWER